MNTFFLLKLNMKENLDFKTFSNQVVTDYKNAFFFKKIIDKFQWSSFYRRELLLSVLSKFATAADLVYNLPFSFIFTNEDNKDSLVNAKNKDFFIQGEELSKVRDFVQNISVVSGMALAAQQIKGNDDSVIFMGLSVAGMTEIDFLKLMELLAESKLRVNIVLLDVHKAKGDFLKVRDYFEPKSPHSLKTLVVDIVDYQSIYKLLSEGVVTTRTTGIPVIFYPLEKLISQVDYFSEETEPLKKIRNWMLVNKLAEEKEMLGFEEGINKLVIE